MDTLRSSVARPVGWTHARQDHIGRCHRPIGPTRLVGATVDTPDALALARFYAGGDGKNGSSALLDPDGLPFCLYAGE
jgi:hypothetical protein